MGETRQPADEQVCAVCGEPITGMTSAPSQPSMDDDDDDRRNNVVWVRLEPCGHTFMVESGGLIY